MMNKSRWLPGVVLTTGKLAATLLLAPIFVAVPNYCVAEPNDKNVCRATGQPCFIGIDPDVFYRLPLYGETIQSGDRQICATTSGSLPLPPESFGIDFMFAFWASLDATAQANIEGAGYRFDQRKLFDAGDIPAPHMGIRMYETRLVQAGGK